jgi:hypothetical protein
MVHLGLTAALLASPAAVTPVEMVCAEREALLTSLSREYAEAPKELGLANNGSVFELLTTRDGRTWTMLMSKPDGTSCVVAAGEAWESVPAQMAGGQPM